MKWLGKIKTFFASNKKEKTYDFDNLDLEDIEKEINNIKLGSHLEDNINIITKFYGQSHDLKVKKFRISSHNKKCAFIFLSKMANSESINEMIKNLKIDFPKVNHYLDKTEKQLPPRNLLQSKEIKQTENLKEIFTHLSRGVSVFLEDGFSRAVLCETKKFEIREIKEPDTEIALRGPREGFVEDLPTNYSLLRRRIRIPQLWLEKMEIGRLSQTEVTVAYIKHLASDELVEEVKKRLKNIDTDIILESGYIEEFIKDNPYTIFPLIERTERPDKAVSCLVEGKVLVMTNNTPFVLIMPTSYNMSLQSPDDYSESFIISSFIRLLRHLSFLISLFLPAFYVAIINFHPELIPVSLLLRISATREGIPFPLVVESLLMESIFEILREAGLRMPRAIGSAISIVGALVLGEAAINAGLVSPPMVIVVALTAIASFTTPTYSLASAARIMRYIFIMAAAIAGLLGLQVGLLILLIHLCSLRSFGQPYFQPYGPLIWRDLKDSIIKLPIWMNIFRPRLIGGKDPQRKDEEQKPESPPEEE
ncbi:MAG: spore germination protein [Halanaerobiaceae bacterium]